MVHLFLILSTKYDTIGKLVVVHAIDFFHNFVLLKKILESVLLKHHPSAFDDIFKNNLAKKIKIFPITVEYHFLNP